MNRRNNLHISNYFLLIYYYTYIKTPKPTTFSPLTVHPFTVKCQPIPPSDQKITMARPIVMFVLLPVSTIILFIGEILLVSADTMVTGMVFCDQCKDGQRSFFDSPLYGTLSFISFISSLAYQSSIYENIK